MTRTLHAVAPSRALALLVAAGFAAVGACSLAAQPASATPGDSHKVWVCKFVQKPGEAEVLKGGKNPIHVDAASLTNDRGVAPQLGDTFSDGQFRSVVVSLGLQAPDTECPAVATADPDGDIAIQPRPLTPATSPTPVSATPTTTGPGTDPGATPTGTPTVPTTPGSEPAPGGLGGAPDPGTTVAFAPVPALGAAAPHTGGLGRVAEQSGYADVLAGGALLVVAGGLVAETVRRRRRATEVD